MTYTKPTFQDGHELSVEDLNNLVEGIEKNDALIKINQTATSDTKLAFDFDSTEEECVLVEESDFNNLAGKVNKMIVVDGTPTTDTIIDFDVSSEYHYIIEKSEFDALTARVAALEAEVLRLSTAIENLTQ